MVISELPTELFIVITNNLNAGDILIVHSSNTSINRKLQYAVESWIYPYNDSIILHSAYSKYIFHKNNLVPKRIPFNNIRSLSLFVSHIDITPFKDLPYLHTLRLPQLQYLHDFTISNSVTHLDIHNLTVNPFKVCTFPSKLKILEINGDIVSMAILNALPHSLKVLKLCNVSRGKGSTCDNYRHPILGPSLPPHLEELSVGIPGVFHRATYDFFSNIDSYSDNGLLYKILPLSLMQLPPLRRLTLTWCYDPAEYEPLLDLPLEYFSLVQPNYKASGDFTDAHCSYLPSCLKTLIIEETAPAITDACPLTRFTNLQQLALVYRYKGNRLTTDLRLPQTLRDLYISAVAFESRIYLLKNLGKLIMPQLRTLRFHLRGYYDDPPMEDISVDDSTFKDSSLEVLDIGIFCGSYMNLPTKIRSISKIHSLSTVVPPTLQVAYHQIFLSYIDSEQSHLQNIVKNNLACKVVLNIHSWITKYIPPGTFDHFNTLHSLTLTLYNVVLPSNAFVSLNNIRELTLDIEHCENDYDVSENIFNRNTEKLHPLPYYHEIFSSRQQEVFDLNDIIFQKTFRYLPASLRKFKMSYYSSINSQSIMYFIPGISLSSLSDTLEHVDVTLRDTRLHSLPKNMETFICMSAVPFSQEEFTIITGQCHHITDITLSPLTEDFRNHVKCGDLHI